jgi:hypothetical protein
LTLRLGKALASVSLLALLASLACSSDASADVSKAEDEKDRIYLTEMAVWFKQFDGRRARYDREESRDLYRELAVNIKPPSGRESDHDTLLTAYALLVETEEHLSSLEPIEQERWIRQGTDAVASCINLQQDWSLLLYASEEFDFTCEANRLAHKIWLDAETKWRVSIFDVYGEDPYGLSRLP